MTAQQNLLMIEELAGFIRNVVGVDTATPQNGPQLTVNTPSTERQLSVN
jgi:hypothetical protein